jgi:dipeptidyl aminopeptidase/acylaminoacyl peptidase
VQSSDRIILNKATPQGRAARQGLFNLLVLLVLGLILSACNLSRGEPLGIYPQKSLPNGSLIFTNHFGIFRLDSEKPINEPVTTLYSSTVSSPLFSPTLLPNSSKMVFIWSRKLPKESSDPSVSAYYPTGVYLLDLTSDQPPTLLWWAHEGSEKPDDPWPSSSRWSADGKSVVFLIGNSVYRNIYKLSPEALTLEQVVDCEGYCQFVIPAPISSRLIFTSRDKTESKQEVGTISILEENGTIKPLIEDKGVDYITKPSWSPDEARIAFTMQVDERGSRSVFLLNTDGTNLLQLTDKGAYHSPVWSPDGKMLAFVEEAQIGERIASRIILMDLQAREMQTLLASPTGLDDLQWLK